MCHLCPLTEPFADVVGMLVQDAQVYRVACDGLEQEGASL